MPVLIDHNPFSSVVKINSSSNYKRTFIDAFKKHVSEDTYMDGNVRKIWSSGNRNDLTYFLYEEAPRLRTIKFNHRYRDEDEEESHHREEEFSYSMWTPWVVYLMSMDISYIQIIKMFFAKESIASSDTQLYFPALPNIYNMVDRPASLCNGAVSTDTVIRNNRPFMQGSIASAISDYWNSPYNDDILAFSSLRPFSIIESLIEDDFSSEEYPPIHDGMMLWSKLTEEEVLQLPMHFMFSVREMMNLVESQYSLSDGMISQKNNAKFFFDKLLYGR